MSVPPESVRCTEPHFYSGHSYQDWGRILASRICIIPALGMNVCRLPGAGLGTALITVLPGQYSGQYSVIGAPTGIGTTLKDVLQM